MLVSGPLADQTLEMQVAEPKFQFVAMADEIEPGKNKAFVVADEDILICHAKDEFFAVENLCSHAMAPLEGGRQRAYRLICPLHGASFDIRDGSVKGQPAFAPIRSYPVRVVDGRIEVAPEPIETTS